MKQNITLMGLMNSVVLDASAFLALVNKEKGHELVKSVLSDAVMSSVNIAEVVGILRSRHCIKENDIKRLIRELIKGVIAFTEEQAYIVGELEKFARDHKFNLSLGDRACLALGRLLDLPIYTADRVWQDLHAEGIIIKIIR